MRKSAAVQVPGRASAKAVASPRPAQVEETLRPGQCRRFMRAKLAEAFPGIVESFVEGARSGSCAHVKLVTELLSEPERPRARGKSSTARMLEEIRREGLGRKGER